MLIDGGTNKKINFA